MATCPNCNGAGEKEGPSWVPPINWQVKGCPMCNGTGEVPADVPRWWSICPKCDGWGAEPPLVTSFTCALCGGRGMISRGRARATGY